MTPLLGALVILAALVAGIGAVLSLPARIRSPYVDAPPTSRQAATARRLATDDEVTTGWKYPIHYAGQLVHTAVGRPGAHRLGSGAPGYYCERCDTHVPHGVAHPCHYLARIQRIQKEIAS